MRTYLFALFMLLLCASTPALAQEPPPALDETTRNILCFGLCERIGDRAFRNIVRIFTAPEPGPLNPKGMRLYVVFVESEYNAGKRQVLYRGPLAQDWERPRTPETLKGVPSDKRPLRYWISRRYLEPGGKEQRDTAEIDLEARPPVVRYLQRDPGKPPREVEEPLVPQPLTPSARLLLRSFPSPTPKTDALTLRPLGVMVEGEYNTSDNAKTPWPENPQYYVISSNDGKQCALHALPKSSGWMHERLLHAVSPKDMNGSFVLEIIESYLPTDAKTPKHTRNRRLRVTLSLKDIRSEVVDDGLHFDVEHDIYYIP